MTTPQTAGPERLHHRICPLCEACCGLEIRTAGERITSIRGTAHDVFSRGYVCPKAVALKDLHEDPDRLRTPLVRRGDAHVPIGWDDAFDEIERGLRRVLRAHGRDAVALSLGNPNAHKLGLLLYTTRLAKALGSKNVFSASTLDQMPKQLSCALMFGHWLSIPVPDIARCDHLLVLGANPIASNGSLWTVPDFRGKAKALRARGGKLVVIDPRRTETAQVADAWHAIQPGTDALLLAAMVQVLFAEGLVRLGRLEPHVNGLHAVRDAVAPFAPERVAARCGIDAPTIRTLARDLAAAQRACVYGRIGTCTQRFGSVASWLVDLLNVLSGHLDEAGGAMFPLAPAFAANARGRPGTGAAVSTGRWASRVSAAPEVMGELPITLLAEEIETPGAGQVRALVSVASNPVLSTPGGPRLERALAQLEFMVSLDIYLNETTRHAHVILPGRSPLEDGHWDVAFPQLSDRNHARYSEAVFAAADGHVPEWLTMSRLAAIVRDRPWRDGAALDDELCAAEVQRAAGAHADAVMKAVRHLQGPERMLDLALRSGPYGDAFGLEPDGLNLAKVRAADGGIDLGELRPRMPEVLRTESGRIELAPQLLVADLANAEALLAEPAPALQIIGRRDVRSNNSWMHNLPTLAKGPERCTLLVHPADAERLGLRHGGRARVSRNGRAVVAPVEITDTMSRGVVCLPHGWGHDRAGTQLGVAAERPGASLNDVLDENLRDPLSGNAVLSGVAVTVQAVA
ncbi:MAG: molybdopterin-dependent oxidoreductase [Burkholderiaceae bacterium]